MKNKHSEINPFEHNWTTTISRQQKTYCYFSWQYDFNSTRSKIIINPVLHFLVKFVILRKIRGKHDVTVFRLHSLTGIVIIERRRRNETLGKWISYYWKKKGAERVVFSSNVFYFDNISYWNRVITPGLTRVPNTSILKSLQPISIIKRFHKMGYTRLQSSHQS